MTAWTSGGDPLPYVPVLEDPAAPHQIVILFAGHWVAVSCTCLNGHGRLRRNRARQVIEARDVFTIPDEVAAWRAWHQERGVPA